MSLPALNNAFGQSMSQQGNAPYPGRQMQQPQQQMQQPQAMYQQGGYGGFGGGYGGNYGGGYGGNSMFGGLGGMGFNPMMGQQFMQPMGYGGGWGGPMMGGFGGGYGGPMMGFGGYGGGFSPMMGGYGGYGGNPMFGGLGGMGFNPMMGPQFMNPMQQMYGQPIPRPGMANDFDRRNGTFDSAGGFHPNPPQGSGPDYAVAAPMQSQGMNGQMPQDQYIQALLQASNAPRMTREEASAYAQHSAMPGMDRQMYERPIALVSPIKNTPTPGMEARQGMAGTYYVPQDTP